MYLRLLYSLYRTQRIYIIEEKARCTEQPRQALQKLAAYYTLKPETGSKGHKMKAKIIAIELRNYRRYLNELGRCRQQLQRPASYYRMTAEQEAEEHLYLQNRIQLLQNTTDAISAAYKEMSIEEHAVVKLKYWTTPALTDAAIAKELHISSSTLYRIANRICKAVGDKLHSLE